MNKTWLKIIFIIVIIALIGISFSSKLLIQLNLVFLKISAFTFGNGFTMIPFIEKDAVASKHWLTMKEFTDGIALSQITPGPVAITATFVGYRVAGLIGALFATISIFLPSTLIMIFATSHYKKIKGLKILDLFFKGIIASIIGMMAGIALSFGRTSIVDAKTAFLGIAALIGLTYFKLEPIWIILAGFILSFILFH